MNNSSNAEFLRKVSDYCAKLGRNYVKNLPTWHFAKSFINKYRNSLFGDSTRSNPSSDDQMPVRKPSVADWLDTISEDSTHLSDTIPMILKLQTPQPWISRTLRPVSPSPGGPLAGGGFKIFKGPFDDYVEFPDMDDPESIQTFINEHENLSKQYFAQNDFTLGIYHCVLALICYPDAVQRLEDEAEYLGRNTLRLATNVLQELTLMKKSQFNEDE